MGSILTVRERKRFRWYKPPAAPMELPIIDIAAETIGQKMIPPEMRDLIRAEPKLEEWIISNFFQRTLSYGLKHDARRWRIWPKVPTNIEHIQLETDTVPPNSKIKVVDVAGPCCLDFLHIRTRNSALAPIISFDGKVYWREFLGRWFEMEGDGASYKAGKIIEYDDAISRYTIHFTPKLFARERITVEIWNSSPAVAFDYDAVRATVSVFRIPE